jgi:hypothetical protein
MAPRIFYLAGALLASVVTNTLAADRDFVGEWNGSGEGSVSATITQSAEGLAAYIGTGTGGCGGEVKVYGKARGNIFIGRSKTEENYTTSCRITMTRKGKTLLLEEDYMTCNEYHGASCGFDSTLKKSNLR